MTIEIPYAPQDVWKDIHKELDRHRFSVLVAHRRFGKTVGTLNQTIKRALMNKLPDPQYAYIAPFRNQAKKIAWSYLKRFTAPIPGVKVNESELYVDLPKANAQGVHGSRIYIFGADHPDAFRGMYFDGVILDEYAQMKPEVYGEILRPALSDRKGWAIFIGTPKGQNPFYDVWKKAQSTKSWYAGMFTIDDTNFPWLSTDEKAAMKEDMSPSEVRQELYCDFTASAYNILIPIDLVSQGRNARITEEQVRGSPLIFGLDPARFGDDDSVLTMRRGLACYEPIRFHGIDNMELADAVASLIAGKNPDAVFIDSGQGSGVIDRLRQLGFSIIEVPFGGKATRDDRYVNKRTEMYDNVRKWLSSGGSLPKCAELANELSIPQFSYDAKGRIKLETKDQIKERIGRSPDFADSLALTFAQKVAPQSKYGGGGHIRANTFYDPLA